MRGTGRAGRRGAAVVVAATVLLGCAGPAATPPEPLLWADEFDGPAGASPDGSAWVPDLGNREAEGWGNHELQWYTDAAENAHLDGAGHLVIAAREAPAGAAYPCFTVDVCPYTSARLTTDGTVSLASGRIEVRARIPNGTGLLPAIWLLGDNGRTWPDQGEVDVAEVVGDEPATVYGTVHGPGYFNEGGVGGATELAAPSGAGFHVYALDKRPGRLTWSVDGVDYLTVTPEDLPDPDDWVFEQTLHLLLDVAVGGDWPGDPDAGTVFPAAMVVDYVRVRGDGVVAPATAAASASR